MKIRIDNQLRDLPALWMDGHKVEMINQVLIPNQITTYTSNSYQETCRAITSMIIRGAPVLGAAGAYGYVQVIYEYENHNLDENYLYQAYKDIIATRPTAIDLRHGVSVVRDSAKQPNFSDAFKIADKFVGFLKNEAKLVSETGSKLLSEMYGTSKKATLNILTHCNTGPLACVDYGTALGSIITAHNMGINVHVWVDETRPRLQGARLTTFELQQAEVPFTLITDNTAGYLMQKEKVDMVVLGGDRVVANGDLANKIGTYPLAVLAQYHNIPFYSAFPSSTYDPSINSGAEILIEERDYTEVTNVVGKTRSNTIERVQISPDNINVLNYAFDVTPASLITGYITPKGILSRKNLKVLLNKEFHKS